MDETNKLTPRQERFCREYLVDLNGSKASIRAGYAARSAHVTASRLLRNPKVAARIAELQAETAKRLEVTRSKTVVVRLHVRGEQLLGRTHRSRSVAPRVGAGGNVSDDL